MGTTLFGIRIDPKLKSHHRAVGERTGENMTENMRRFMEISQNLPDKVRDWVRELSISTEVAEPTLMAHMLADYVARIEAFKDTFGAFEDGGVLPFIRFENGHLVTGDELDGALYAYYKQKFEREAKTLEENDPWADAKMPEPAPTPTPPKPKPATDPELEAYKRAIAEKLAPPVKYNHEKKLIGTMFIRYEQGKETKEGFAKWARKQAGHYNRK